MLEKKLDEALGNFNQEIQFHLETFDQRNNDGIARKEDVEFLARQVFYCLMDFKKSIVNELNKRS